MTNQTTTQKKTSQSRKYFSFSFQNFKCWYSAFTIFPKETIILIIKPTNDENQNLEIIYILNY